ncbi:hypothetical protein [Haliangium sp.]|uniref:hypothetical protein n=1 Tax=Haliangium sp. TaxID=2663208 RepID=UPI003D0B7386
MKSLSTTLCIAMMTAAFTACVMAPQEDIDVDDSQASLTFEPGDPDITWSGPGSYSALWAKKAFKPNPGLYILRLGSNAIAGAVYLSAKVLCRFSSYEEAPGQLFIESNDCSGPFEGLTVELACTKQSGDLSCVGQLVTAAGQMSELSASIEREEVCAPGTCFIGPLDPMRPGPNGPGDCHPGESPCGGGCCLRGERCDDGSCFIPEEEDAAIGDREGTL